MLGLGAQCYQVGDTALVGSAVIAGCGAGVFSDYKAAIRKTIQEEVPLAFNKENHEHYKGIVRKYLAVINASGVYKP